MRIVNESENDTFSPIEVEGSFTFINESKTYRVDIDNSILENKRFVFRLRQNTDKFTYYKRNLTKPLRKAMNEAKIPSELRDKLILLADEQTVLWCEDIGYSEQGEIYRQNKQLSIEIKEG